MPCVQPAVTHHLLVPIPGICYCAILKLNLSFPVNFQCRPLGSRHRRALAEPTRLRHPQVFAVLPLLSQGEGARLVLLRPAFPSHKFNCAKQKNRLEIEPCNKEGLISFVSVLAFCFSVCLLFFCFFFFLPLSAEGVCLHSSAKGLFWRKQFRLPSHFTGKHTL